MKNEVMKVRDLLKREIDIDVWDNVCEELGVAFCGPMELTEEGMKEFGEALDYEVEIHYYPQQTLAVVDVDGEEGVWQKKLKLAKRLFYGMAGFCSDADWKKWFREAGDEYEDNHCFPQEVRDVFDDMEGWE